MKKKVLISGSCGFIFSNFVRKIIYEKHPYTIISVDRVNTNAINSIYWNKNHVFHIADIRDEHILDVIFQFEKPDVVIHGAASTFVDDSLKDPNTFITNNVLGTQNIINCCLKHKVPRLIYISTDEVYGQLTNESDPSWTEEDRPNARNPYSSSKLAGEFMVKAAHYSHGLQYNITRSSNNYGPRQTSEKLIPKVIKNIMHNTPIPVYGKGLQIRDWTHVFDNCAAILTVLNNGKPNEIYNISANQEFSNIEVVQKICNAMGEGHTLVSHVKDRAGHDFRYSIDSSKLRALGWKPQWKFSEGIIQTVDWYKLNQWFLK
jgi:dTDP-glucose 4,6-dehydratase